MKINYTLNVLFTFFTLSVFAQTIVSTEPENKKVVLEEFTGITCGYCPDGHTIAQNIQNNNPGNVFLINIHQGGFANPGNSGFDFRTPFGNALAAQVGANFYPSGTINRNSNALGRGSWTSAANTALGQSSDVNIGVEADIDVQTNTITVHVEAFYTADSPESNNKLNVALLQNNTIGPQTDYANGNTTEYNHMHRLVWLITGQWGEVITTTTAGTFIDETYTYDIPDDYNGVPVKIEDLEVVAFITETQLDMPSGSGTFPTYSNFSAENNMRPTSVEAILPQCGFDIAPNVTIQNFGENDLTEVEITYSVNGGASQNYTWTGSLLSLQSETVELPAISYVVQDVNTIEISLSDDDDNSDNQISENFDIANEHTTTINMILNTDNAGSQCTWEIMNAGGETLYSGGPYSNNESVVEQFELTDDCYRFRVFDSAGNGGGSIVLYDTNNDVVYNSPGNYGAGEEAHFKTVGELGNNDNVLGNVVIYPNPAKNNLNIQNAENSSVKVFDLLGRVVLLENNISLNQQIDVSKLTTGTYLIKIINGNQVKTDKFIINR
ncbi:Omp28-related outer membrane protein [Flavobacteriaceae bacterium]|nr:Omp28-related outer membrane protein [Flavobacteriaceae bacterium]